MRRRAHDRQNEQRTTQRTANATRKQIMVNRGDGVWAEKELRCSNRDPYVYRCDGAMAVAGQWECTNRGHGRNATVWVGPHSQCDHVTITTLKCTIIRLEPWTYEHVYNAREIALFSAAAYGHGHKSSAVARASSKATRHIILAPGLPNSTIIVLVTPKWQYFRVMTAVAKNFGRFNNFSRKLQLIH